MGCVQTSFLVLYSVERTELHIDETSFAHELILAAANADLRPQSTELHHFCLLSATNNLSMLSFSQLVAFFQKLLHIHAFDAHSVSLMVTPFIIAPIVGTLF